ncbi:EAL domain-containing protein [Allocoleopsis sp.]|uniref:EAL domain-containing protein n=1 Tax=Allocoleopsis sp. TaxID=3088169 RepID=UPI002FD74B7D
MKPSAQLTHKIIAAQCGKSDRSLNPLPDTLLMLPEQNVNILLVDDQPKNLLTLSAILDSPGLNLVTADSGLQALRCLLNHDFAVILLDVQMPLMDGFETAALIRQRERSQHTPIIFITALNQDETHVERGYSLGAVDYLLKPFAPEIIKSKVTVFVELFKKTQLLEQQTALLEAANKKLECEITQRKIAEEALRHAHDSLEIKVQERTAQLAQANASLQAEITQRKMVELALFQEKEQAQVTLQSIGDGVITINAQGLVEYLNPVASELTGFPVQEAKGKPLSDIVRIVDETTREVCKSPAETAMRSGKQVCLDKPAVLITREGDELAVDNCATPLRASDNQIIGAVLVLRDVTAARHIEQQLSWQASHDALTGLVNRRFFENCLQKAVMTAKTSGQQHALCYLDLDQFKLVNDTCGHIAGDELLRQVTALFQSLVRSSDTLARLGGDEFGLLLFHCPLDAAERVASKLREQIQEFRFVWQGKTFSIGVSIGLVAIDANTQGVTSVMSAADSACYAAKNKGRNRVQVYQADDHELALQQSQMQWVARLTQALEENRFCLYYQSIVPSRQTSSLATHYEILLRLIDEQGNLVSPMAFIPAAERYNLMHCIDRWVIRTLFTSLGRHYREKQNPCRLLGDDCDCLYAINISGASVSDEQFIEFVREQLVLHEVPPQVICFEITETVAIANLRQAAQFMRSLKQVGCRFALDDFGSGMSSFAYLKNLPVDYLKIDGGFVRQIVDEPTDLAMVEAINHIGHVMGLQTIAEFVENKAILEKITAIRVDYAQGYGIAKPRPLLLN